MHLLSLMLLYYEITHNINNSLTQSVSSSVSLTAYIRQQECGI